MVIYLCILLDAVTKFLRAVNFCEFMLSDMLYHKNLIFANLQKIRKSAKFTALKNFALYGNAMQKWEVVILELIPHNINTLSLYRYLHRLDDELDSITERQERGCLSAHYRMQHASREDTIRLLITQERHAFLTTGIGSHNIYIIFIYHFVI